MLVYSSKALLELYRIHEEIHSNFSASKEEKEKAFNAILKDKISGLTKYYKTFYTNLLKSKYQFENEYIRLIKAELRDEAINKGEITFRSLTKCGNKLDTGKTCGNTIRYTSNRGCTVCQSSGITAKNSKNIRAKEILDEYAGDNKPKSKTTIVNRLMGTLGIKKSAAYRLIELHEKGEPLYKISEQPCYESPDIPNTTDVIRDMITQNSSQNFNGGDFEVGEEVYVDYDDFSQLDDYDINAA